MRLAGVVFSMQPDGFPHLAEAGLVGAVAHPVRLKVLQELTAAPLPMPALALRLGVQESVLAHHVAELVSHQLVEKRRDRGLEVLGVVEPRLVQAVHVLNELAVRLHRDVTPSPAPPPRATATPQKVRAHAY